MLQKFMGDEISLKELKILKKKAKKFGFRDVRSVNTGKISNGRAMIYDLNYSPTKNYKNLALSDFL